MDESTYIKEMFDVTFISQYEFISKQIFNKYVRKNIQKKLNKFSNIVNKSEIFKYSKNILETEKYLCNILKKSYERTILVRHNDLPVDEMNKIANEIIEEQIITEAVDNIVLLEEIDYLNSKKEIDKTLNIAYLYILEVEIYKYFDIFNFKWKNDNNKLYINDRIKCLLIEKRNIKQDIINRIDYKKSLYDYKKFIGLNSIFPINEILENNYEVSIMNDIYKTKYLLASNEKNNLYIEKESQIKKRLNEQKKYKLLTQNILNKYKKVLEKRDNVITELEKEKCVLEKENNTKQGIIENYANYINEYNKMSFVKKIKMILKKEKIKLLN